MNTNQFPSNFASEDWETQLAVFKAFYSIDDINVKYLDDEREEIGISCQSDLDYAYQMALNSDDKLLHLILTKENGDVIAKPFLKINPMKTKRSSNNQVKLKEFKNETVLNNTVAPNFNEAQKKWLQNYLENFRKEITNEFEAKVRNLMKQNEKSLKSVSQINEDLIELDVDPSMSFENKVKRIIDMILNARTLGRALKSAYLEEELYAMGAFCAIFVKDHNMPDGSKCEPNMKFVKTWLIQNTGKLQWNDLFPVKLICIAGNIIINSENQSVDVANTKVNETASISVELIAPSNPGNYFSEWVLSCHDFQFGPRIWCSIEVIDTQISVQSSIATTELVLDGSNMSKSCFTKTNSRSSDLKSVNSLNISMIETFLSSNNQSKSSQFVEDLDDDEFVVVPDCFDLTKKWKTNQIDSELRELKRSMMDENKCNSSFVNVDDKKEMDLLNESIYEYKSDVDKKLEQLTESVKKLSNNNDLIMLNSTTESNISSNKNENTTNLTVDISVSPQALSQSQYDYLTYNPVTILENNKNNSNMSSSSESKTDSPKDEVNSINLIPLTPAVVKNKSASELHKENPNPEQLENSEEKNLDHLSTFDLMKNTFSNLQAQSYTSSHDLRTNKTSESFTSNLSFSNSPLSPSVFKPKKPQTPMEKLISMGFADRNLNKRLLEKYNNDLEKVIDSICQRFDINDWSLNR